MLARSRGLSFPVWKSPLAYLLIRRTPQNVNLNRSVNYDALSKPQKDAIDATLEEIKQLGEYEFLEDASKMKNVSQVIHPAGGKFTVNGKNYYYNTMSYEKGLQDMKLWDLSRDTSLKESDVKSEGDSSSTKTDDLRPDSGSYMSKVDTSFSSDKFSVVDGTSSNAKLQATKPGYHNGKDQTHEIYQAGLYRNEPTLDLPIAYSHAANPESSGGSGSAEFAEKKYGMHLRTIQKFLREKSVKLGPETNYSIGAVCLHEGKLLASICGPSTETGEKLDKAMKSTWNLAHALNDFLGPVVHAIYSGAIYGHFQESMASLSTVTEDWDIPIDIKWYTDKEKQFFTDMKPDKFNTPSGYVGIDKTTYNGKSVPIVCLFTFINDGTSHSYSIIEQWSALINGKFVTLPGLTANYSRIDKRIVLQYITISPGLTEDALKGKFSNPKDKDDDTETLTKLAESMAKHKLEDTFEPKSEPSAEKEPDLKEEDKEKEKEEKEDTQKKELEKMVVEEGDDPTVTLSELQVTTFKWGNAKIPFYIRTLENKGPKDSSIFTILISDRIVRAQIGYTSSTSGNMVMITEKNLNDLMIQKDNLVPFTAESATLAALKDGSIVLSTDACMKYLTFKPAVNRNSTSSLSTFDKELVPKPVTTPKVDVESEFVKSAKMVVALNAEDTKIEKNVDELKKKFGFVSQTDYDTAKSNLTIMTDRNVNLTQQIEKLQKEFNDYKATAKPPVVHSGMKYVYSRDPVRLQPEKALTPSQLCHAIDKLYLPDVTEEQIDAALLKQTPDVQSYLVTKLNIDRKFGMHFQD